ncbi:MAG TPA: DinB family protein [bacterium]|nr:DinB family protein [bacterium]
MSDPLLDQFRKNFEYDHWANGLFLEALEDMPDPPEKAIKGFAHILFALDVWLARLMKEDLSTFTDPNPPYSLAESRRKLEDLHGKWKGYLSGLTPEGMRSQLAYQNLKGKKFEQSVQNILVHVSHHSHYHRGQLASLIAQAGGKRPNTDYGAYVMETGEVRAL